MLNTLINGVPAEHINVADRGLNYGDGLFETLLFSNGKCQFWEQHLLRMKQGAQRLNIAFPGEDCFFDDVIKLIKHSMLQDIVIKLMLTRGSSLRGYGISGKVKPLRITTISTYHSQQQLSSGINVTVCKQSVSMSKALAGIKHLNRLDNVIARNEWQDEFHEGIMLDDDGFVIEGTMSNLFIVTNNELQTPDLSKSGVAGIIRENILNIASDENIDVSVKQLSLDNVYDADEIFVTNSVIGLWPVIKINDIDFKFGEISKLIQKELHQRCRDNAKNIK